MQPASGSTFPLGTTKVTCTPKDSGGTPSTPPGDVNAKLVTGKGKAKVKVPGSNSYVSVDQAQDLPPGTTVDVSRNVAIAISSAASSPCRNSVTHKTKFVKVGRSYVAPMPWAEPDPDTSGARHVPGTTPVPWLERTRRL